MNIRLIALTLLGFAVLGSAGCSKVGEPWDSREYFKEERARTAEQQKALHERLAQGQIGERIGKGHL